MTAESIATTKAPTTITSDIAGANNGDAVSTKTIDEAQYQTSPIELFPNTVQEEIHHTRGYATNQNGDEYYLNNNNQAFAIPGYNEVFQAKMQKTVKNMIDNAQANNSKKPVISLQTVDYGDYGLKSNKEYFTVDATTLQSFKSSRALREAGITVLGMPSPGAKFELVAYDQTGKPITGNEWNNFFDQYGAIVAQEQAEIAS